MARGQMLKTVTSEEIERIRQGRQPQRVAALQAFDCPMCDRPFRQVRRWQKFCSAKCRNDHHNEQRLARTHGTDSVEGNKSSTANSGEK
jgi:hypothetical protein